MKPRTSAQNARVRDRVAAIVARFPEARALRVDEHLSLEVRQRRFGWFLVDHHGDGRLGINCRVPALLAVQLQSSVPSQFHIPRFAGSKGWIGLWLDVPRVDWVQVELCLEAAYREKAPKRLLTSLKTRDAR